MYEPILPLAIALILITAAVGVGYRTSRMATKVLETVERRKINEASQKARR